MMLSNSAASRRRPDGADAELVHLPRWRRRLADAAGGDLDVLLAQRTDHVAGRDLARGEAIGIEPQAHRILALAEDGDVADAGHALQGVAHVDVEVVAQEERVVLSLLREDAHRHHEAGGLLLHADAVGAHFCRHAAERLVHAVLHVDGGDVLVAGDVERDGDRRDTTVGARRGHVQHALDAVDGLLERGRDRRLDFLRVRRRCKTR